MFKNKTCIAIVLLVGVLISIAIAVTERAPSSYVHVSLKTESGVMTYSMFGRDFGTNQVQVARLLKKIVPFSSNPVQIVVDTNTTFVGFASFLDLLNQTCPNAKWFAVYKAGPKNIKVLYDAKAKTAFEVEWIPYLTEEPEHAKTTRDDRAIAR